MTKKPSVLKPKSKHLSSLFVLPQLSSLSLAPLVLCGSSLLSRSSIFSKNDFCARRFQTQANLDSQTSKDLENNEPSYSKSNCDSVDASLQVGINDNSSAKLSATSNSKTSSRHDLAMIFTCKVCETRPIKTVCRQSYKKGVVVAHCGGCNTYT